MDEKLITITEAAEVLGVSVDTLRRWDESGKLSAIRKDGGTHRYYTKRNLEMFASDLLGLANGWAFAGTELPSQYYCSNSAVFQARLTRMQDEIMGLKKDDPFFSLIVAAAGEIGNNSYDHNLGNWPDTPGIFFGYNLSKKEVVLADRGVGILQTLKRVRPELKNHQEALRVAFTDIVSGRAPEERGNGLKFVRLIVMEYPINLFFQTGDAELRLHNKDSHLNVTRSQMMIRGCLTRITF